MERADRAKQFQPFDAMKGLKEALKKKEEQHLRSEKNDITPEMCEKNSRTILMLEKGDKVFVKAYYKFHNIEFQAQVREIDLVYKYIRLRGLENSFDRKLFFDNIYVIKIIG